MPSSRATARSERAAAPCSASWRRASCLISLVSSMRARSRAVRGALTGRTVADEREQVSRNESTALDIEELWVDTAHQRERCSPLVKEPLMSLHVIVGAGPVGSTTAELLAAAGHEVRVVTRSGSGPSHPLVERVAADVSDSEALAKLCIGADALYNCANPAYHQWATDWPPMARALLAAATATGAV